MIEALGWPLRWFMTETAKAFHKARGRRGHFWERRYQAVIVEDDLYALAALRYLDRNPVRAGLVDDPTAYPWSSCATYAVGTPNALVTLHPSYLGLSPYPAVRQRHYRTLLAPSTDPQADAQDPGWTTQRAVGVRGVRRPVHPSAGPPQNRFCAAANSGTWSVRGVRYLFPLAGRADGVMCCAPHHAPSAAKICSRASTISRTWKIIGVRYLFL